MTIHYLCGDEWREFSESDYLIIHQNARTGIAGLMGKMPVVVNHNEQYYCSKSVFGEIKRKHKKVATFDAIIKKTPPDISFGRLFNLL